MDTLKIFKKMLTGRKDKGAFTLSTLATEFLTLSPDADFHEGLFDCQVLQELIKKMVDLNELNKNIEYFKDCMQISITPVS